MFWGSGNGPFFTVHWLVVDISCRCRAVTDVLLIWPATCVVWIMMVEWNNWMIIKTRRICFCLKLMEELPEILSYSVQHKCVHQHTHRLSLWPLSSCQKQKNGEHKTAASTLSSQLKSFSVGHVLCCISCRDSMKLCCHFVYVCSSSSRAAYLHVTLQEASVGSTAVPLHAGNYTGTTQRTGCFYFYLLKHSSIIKSEIKTSLPQFALISVLSISLDSCSPRTWTWFNKTHLPKDL